MSKHHQRASWKRLSKQQRTAQPICADPFGWHELTGRYELATEVHHIENVQEYPEKLLDTENLINVCSVCHKALHGKFDALQTMLDSGINAETLAETIAKGGRGGKIV